MKKILLTTFLLVLSSSVFAWTIGPMNYQGRLLDNNGVPVTGSYNFTVSIYDAITGGTLKYSELQNNIAVNDGVYSFLVSTGVTQSGTWDINLWNTPTLYLEIVVNGQTLTPRHLLAAAPFAFQANLALTTNNALALGGVSAGQYQNTLADICKSSKGKWLELVSKCLGVGAQFPGPGGVMWQSLTASNDFTNLDLSKANISGIGFNGANLQKSIFNGTTYSVNFLTGADLRDTRWDGAIATDLSPVNIGQIHMEGTYFSNMDMSKWNLAGNYYPYMTAVSAANLSACPASVAMANFPWQCRLMYPAGSKYFLLGFGVNLSSNSSATSVKQGVSYLDLDANALNGVNIWAASFTGNVITQNFVNTTVNQSDFSYATIRGVVFDNALLSGANFSHSKIDKVTFIDPSLNLSGQSFVGSELTSVVFKDQLSSVDFTGATLRNVSFTNLNGNLTSATLDNVTINSSLYSSTLDKTRIYNGLFVNQASGNTYTNVYFSGGRLAGNFLWETFAGPITFQNMVFDHLNLCSVTMPVTGTTAPYPDFKTVSWGVVVCPNGNAVAGGTDNCNTIARMISSQGSNCAFSGTFP